jgi:NAD(P) transhydrogenase subunit alpha
MGTFGAIGLPRETFPGEERVGLSPAVVPALVKAGWTVTVEEGAGSAAGFPDATFEERGATVVSRDRAFEAPVLVQVRTPGANPVQGQADLSRYRGGQAVVGLADPLDARPPLLDLAARGAVVFALELMPRSTRAQAMDVLSSQATIAGYKAVLLAAESLPKIFPMLTTAAGTIAPARVLVIGAGVAGLQAIATARRLGGVVQAYDVRQAAREEVESLGARFVELPLNPGDAEDASGYAKALGEAFYRRQQELLGEVVSRHDVVICTALIPGKPAPVLVTEDAVRAMAPGSVVVDLAAERGGNCAVTRAGETVSVGEVTVMGPTNLAATVPQHASQMYAKNVTAFLLLALKDGLAEDGSGPVLDMDDPIVAQTLVCRGGTVTNQRVAAAAAPAKEAVAS